MPCQSQADCACLGDFCAGVTDSIFPTATDPSKIDCCDGFCVNFAVSPLQDCSELASSGISCPFTGAPAPECGQGSDCQAITGVPGFYNCEIFCCVTRLPERVGEGQACVDNPLVEPQCDFGMKCESGICVKICGDDPSGQAIFTCDQVTWFGPEASCENLGFGPCDQASGCCGAPPPPGPCAPFPACGDVGNDCSSVGLTGTCATPADCCGPPATPPPPPP